MPYTKLFNPLILEQGGPPETRIATAPSSEGIGDRTPKGVFVFDEQIVLAVNVALAAGRPLLVRGPSGVGKSALAKAVADEMGRRFIEVVATSRMQARDLLWEVDLVKRLQDAQAGVLGADWARYVRPGPLWRAFDKVSADAQAKLAGHAAWDANSPDGAVVLIDEIDKAEPDVPNDLLRPLGSLEFAVDELESKLVRAEAAPLIVITTNEERDLPTAFLRRCVELRLEPHDAAGLLRIGRHHRPEANPALVKAVADAAAPNDGEVRQRTAQSRCSAAEFLDLLRACIELNISPDDPTFAQVRAIAFARAERSSP